MNTASRRVARVTASAVALVVLGAGPALADPEPVLECVAANPDDSYSAVFGVDNDGPGVTIPIGKDTNGKLDNRFSGDEDRGQPTVFAAGRSVDVFTLDVPDGKDVTWHLGSSKLTVGHDDEPCSDPAPVLECVAANPDGSYTAVFGVDNDGPGVTIPVGKDTVGKLDNRFDGDDDRGQPTVFAAGRSVGVFTLDVLDGKDVTWELGSSKLTVGRDGTPCSEVPVAPDVPTVVLGAAAAAVGAAWAFRRVDGRAARA